MKTGTKFANILRTAAVLLLCAGCAAKAPDAPAQTDAGQTVSEAQAAPRETAAAPSAEQVDYAEIYAPVLDETFDVLYNGYSEGEDYQYVPTGITEMSRWGDARERIRSVGYCIGDISGNGTPELLIGIVPTDAQTQDIIFGGYACKDGTIVPFLDGWYRNSYRWMGEGRFYFSGSGGAMYAIFGTCRVSADGTALSYEDYYFTHETDGSPQEIGYYHNQTGDWDTAASEKLDVTEDAFWAIRDDLESQCAPLDLTPFAEYPYTGYVSQPLDCKVRADYLDDVALELSDYENAAELFGDLYPTDAEYETTVVFRSAEDVADFTLLALTVRDADEVGNVGFDRAEVFHVPELKAGAALAVPMRFPGDMPSNGFSYTDADGSTKAYTIGVSGKDGSLFVAPLE